jgi:hypothetical protein
LGLHSNRHQQQRLLIAASALQGLSKKFYHWKCCISALAEQGRQLPPLKLTFDKMNQSQMLKALCSLETNEVGYQLLFTDARVELESCRCSIAQCRTNNY